MRFDLLVLIVALIFITMGYAKQLNPRCTDNVEVKYVPRELYDNLLINKE
tara:strand:- start:3103 stop:3252 length:150 start_codon:yes stop_codon:yes gene_type:complete